MAERLLQTATAQKMLDLMDEEIRDFLQVSSLLCTYYLLNHKMNTTALVAFIMDFSRSSN